MELLNRHLNMIFLISATMFLANCSFFNSTVKVEVPKGYIGWCYLIPVKDSTNIVFNINDGKYKVDESGIVYVPASLLNLKEDNIVTVYENGVDISDVMRYVGNVSKVVENGKKYEFIAFFIPTLEERKIADSKKYWRDKRYEYTKPESIRFDSLLRINKIVFK